MDDALINTGLVTSKMLDLGRRSVLRPGERAIDYTYLDSVWSAHEREMMAILVVRNPGKTVHWPPTGKAKMGYVPA